MVAAAPFLAALHGGRIRAAAATAFPLYVVERRAK
jgi:hypothetical protein